ncbi:MAG: AarF/UbiB family protein [Polyangiales bacterium]|jgi:ubiquinone biosynthesis protein
MPSILNTVRDLERLRQIAGVLAVHGFGEVVERTGLSALIPGRKRDDAGRMPAGIRLRKVLEDLGPSFVKLGQIMSTRPDLIPEDILVELKKLQDEVAPEPFEAIRTQVERELGCELAEVYESFDEVPLASASIAQVHRARLRDGAEAPDVVVKVQRPKVQALMARDIDLLYWLAKAIVRSMPESHLYRPVSLVEEFDRSVAAELDFSLEADNHERFTDNFQHNPHAKFPKVYRRASAKRVLTLEYLEGRKVYAAQRAGVSGELMAKRSVEIIVQQIFEDGFFHADPHPGNIIILGADDDPVIGMVDVGMVGRLSPKMRDRTIELMLAAVREDYSGIADALYTIGRPAHKINRDAYDAEVATLAQRYLGKRLKEIEIGPLIRDLVMGSRKFGVEIPSEFLMLGKSIMTVEGVGKEIYPELDLLEEVRPYFMALFQQRYSPERMTQDALRGLRRLGAATTEMPLQVEEILEDLRKGAFTVRTQQTQLESAADRLGRRAFSGLVVGSLIIAGAILLSQESYWLGGLAAASGAVYALGHSARVWLLGRPEP